MISPILECSRKIYVLKLSRETENLIGAFMFFLRSSVKLKGVPKVMSTFIL